MSKRMTAEELKKVKIERCVQSIFSRDDGKIGALNACRYLEKNGVHGVASESAVNMISNIALAFAAGELDWVKDLGREEE